MWVWRLASVRIEKMGVSLQRQRYLCVCVCGIQSINWTILTWNAWWSFGGVYKPYPRFMCKICVYVDVNFLWQDGPWFYQIFKRCCEMPNPFSLALYHPWNILSRELRIRTGNQASDEMIQSCQAQECCLRLRCPPSWSSMQDWRSFSRYSYCSA